MCNIHVIIKLWMIVCVCFLLKKTDQLVPQRKNNYWSGLTEQWSKMTKLLSYIHCLMVCFITMAKHIQIILLRNFGAEDMCMFLHCGLKRQQTVFRFHCHVDIFMWWHTNTNIAILFTTMNIIYNYSTQQIVESMIGVCYWAWVSQKKELNLCWFDQYGQTKSLVNEIK